MFLPPTPTPFTLQGLFAFESATETKQFSRVKSLLTHDAVQWHEKMLGRKQRIHPMKKRLIWIFKRREAEKKGQEGSSDFRETSVPWEENGSLIPQLAQQVQFTAKVGNLLNPHLSFKRVPRFPSTIVSSAFFKHQRRWNCPHLSVESEFEGFGFSAEVIVRKGKGRGKVTKLFYQ